MWFLGHKCADVFRSETAQRGWKKRFGINPCCMLKELFVFQTLAARTGTALGVEV